MRTAPGSQLPSLSAAQLYYPSRAMMRERSPVSSRVRRGLGSFTLHSASYPTLDDYVICYGLTRTCRRTTCVVGWKHRCLDGANGEGRTPMAFRPPDPKSGASASSATFAYAGFASDLG